MSGDGVVDINSIFLEPVNRVLWRIITGKPIEAGPDGERMFTFRNIQSKRIQTDSLD